MLCGRAGNWLTGVRIPDSRRNYRQQNTRQLRIWKDRRPAGPVETQFVSTHFIRCMNEMQGQSLGIIPKTERERVRRRSSPVLGSFDGDNTGKKPVSINYCPRPNLLPFVERSESKYRGIWKPEMKTAEVFEGRENRARQEKGREVRDSISLSS